MSEDLGKRRLVALAVVVRSQEDRDATVGRDANLRHLVEADTGAHRGGQPGGRDARRLDVAGNADAAQLCRILLFSFPKTSVVGNLQRALEYLWKVAAVVGRSDRRLVGHGRRWDEIAAADLGAIKAEFLRRLVGEALEHVAGLGAAGAAVGVGRQAVAEETVHFDEYRRRAVQPGEKRAVDRTGDRRAEGRHIGAEVGTRRDL